MKYLIQHRKEFIITLGVLCSVLLIIVWSVWSIVTGNLDYRNLIAVAGGIFEVLGWYYNMPTSDENCEATGYMRQRKAEKKADYKGEKFHE